MQKMTNFVFTIGILFCFNFVTSCKGCIGGGYSRRRTINLPREGDTFFRAPGTDVEIAWTFNYMYNYNIANLTSRKWFTEMGSLLARIVRDLNVQIENTGSQLGVGVKKPGTLILKNVDLRHNGTYEFEIILTRNIKESSYVTVFVYVNSSLTINCTSPLKAITSNNVTSTLRVKKSDDVICLCKDEAGNPPTNVTWYKNGVQHGVPQVKEHMLSLSNVHVTDSATYKCDAQSHTLKDEKSIEVIVNSNSSLTINCTSPLKAITSDNVTSTLRVKKSDDVICLCKDEAGNPPTNVTWYKNGVQHGVPQVKENMLFLSNVHETDSGTYKCEAQSHTLKDEKSIQVIVNFAPLVTSLTSSPKKAVFVGKAVTISCEARGLPSPSYTIIHDDTHTVSTEKNYTIAFVNGSDAGSYQCIARNELGNSSKTFNLTVIPVGPVQTTTPGKENSANKGTVAATNTCICSKGESGSVVVVWHVVVSLLSGFIIGILLFCIVGYSRIRFRNKKPQSSPEPQVQLPNKMDSIYQDLDLSKMNQEENYQTLGTVNSGNSESDYMELNLAKDVEENYESLTS